MANKKVCLLCLKRFDPLVVGNQNKGYQARLLSPSRGPEAFTAKKLQGHEDLYSRFLRFSSRYLKLPSSDRLLERNKVEGSEVIYAFCEKCFEIVSCICDLYAELNTIKIHLLWKLKSIPDLIRNSKKSASLKLANGLMKTLSAQLNVEVACLVGQWRKKVAFKCALKVNTGVPRPIIHRGLFPEHWKFTEASTTRSLAGLIVVFLLASAEVYRTPKPDNETQTVIKRRRPGRKRLHDIHNDKRDSPVKVKFDDGKVEEDTFNDDGQIDSISNHGGSGSDWSAGASPATFDELLGSDNENFENAEPAVRSERWNFRKIRKRVIKMGVGSDSEEETAKDKDKEFKVKKEPKKRRLKSVDKTDTGNNVSCNKCSKTFQDQRGLSKHLVAIHRVKLCYPCPICGMKFGRRVDMQTHKSKMHNTGYAFGKGARPKECKCTRCEEIFPSVKAMVVHRKLNHKIRWTKHGCPICYKTVVSEQRFKKHLAAHGKDCEISLNVYYCEVCGQNFDYEGSLSSHMVEVHDGSFSCLQCNAKHPTATALRYHLKTHETDDKKYSCALCFKRFTNKQFYDVHRKMAHRGIAKLYCDKDKCSEEFDFDNIEALNKHLRSHVLEDKKPNLVTDSDTDHLLPAGQTIDDENNLEGLHVCTQCGWGFLKKYNLTLHALVHTPHKENGTGYDCPICGVNVRYIATLVTHYNRLHGGDIKPYHCDICENDFTSHIWYKVHMKLHEEKSSGESIVCNICNAKFLDLIGLNSHKRRQHSIKRSYEHEYMDPASPPSNGNCKLKKTVRGRGRPRLYAKTQAETESKPKHEKKAVSFPCEECNETFESAYILRKHLEASHEDGEEKSFFCYFCYRTFCHEQTHTLHLKAEHRTVFNKFECDGIDCDGNFTTLAELNEHLKTHDNELVTHEINDENKSNSASAGEINEYNQNNKLANKVNVKNDSLQNNNTFECNPDTITPARNTIKYCETCNWGFMDGYNLELHILSHIPKENDKFRCPGCAVEFSGIPMLRHHYNVFHGKSIKRFKCHECNKKMFSRVGLNLHIMRHNRRRKEGPDPIVVCAICGSTFKDAYLLKQHMKRHDPANHVSCSECNAKFEIKKHLDVHMRQKHGHGEKYPCPVCGVTFIYTLYLKQHMRVHQEASYECNICHKLFKRPHALAKHMKTHNPNRVSEFICAECGMEYKTDVGLKYHILSKHTSVELLPYSCPHCQKRYHRKMLLNMHVKTCAKLHGVSVESEETEIPKRQPSTRKRRKKVVSVKEPEEEVELSQTSTNSESEEISDEDVKNEDIKTVDDLSLEDKYSPSSSSATNLNTLNAIVTKLTGVPLIDANERRSSRRTNSNDVVKRPPVSQTSSSSGTGAFQATLDHMMSLCQPPPKLSTAVPTTQSPELRWLNSAPVPQQSPQPHLPLPPLPYPQLFGSNQFEQHHLPYQMYSPDNSYASQEQPQNLHYSPFTPTSN